MKQLLIVINHFSIPSNYRGEDQQSLEISTGSLINSLLGIEIPKYVGTVTTQYKLRFDALLVGLKEAKKVSLKEYERIEKEIADMQEMKISTMTADEDFEKQPKLKQKFDDDIRNDYWGY